MRRNQPAAVSEAFLEASAEAGAVVECGGHRCVAGSYLEPISGEQQCLVEYADPALTTAAAAARLPPLLAELFPEAEVAVLRTPADVALPAPWTRYLSYVKRAVPVPRSAPDTAGGDGMTVTEPAEGDRERVTRWLEAAFLTAGDSQGGDCDAEAAAAQARAVLETPGSRFLIARSAGTAVGHATLLCDAYDEVSGEPYVELVDILIDPPHDVRTATAALVTAAGQLADGLGLPLIGHVVHPRHPDRRAEGQRVLDSLLRKGWEMHSGYWWAPLTGCHAEQDADRRSGAKAGVR
ncbi:hypothetical protein ACFW95_10075 [Streptomyces sp. NPDC059474]|uniref:hypothetical protein n=1 Tax=unclassified Streptomyces TaxID=2593676 RepID=UPI0033EB63D6